MTTSWRSAPRGLREHLQAQLSAPALRLPGELPAASTPIRDGPAAPERLLVLSRVPIAPGPPEFELVETDETDRKELEKTVRFDAPPDAQQLRRCARAWADIAFVAARRAETRKVLVLADLWLVPPLERELRARELIPVYPHMLTHRTKTASGARTKRKLVGIVPSLAD